MNAIATCAALYFEPDAHGSVPLSWFESVSQFFRDISLPLQGFCITADGFSEQEYSLTDQEQRLVEALQQKCVERLSMDSSLLVNAGGYDYRGEISINPRDGTCFLGVDESVVDNSSILIRRIHEFTRELPRLRYGIGYKWPVAKAPGAYADGVHYGTMADAQQWFKGSSSVEFQRIAAWSNEMSRPRRYLTGMFRGAYAANLLSDAHVNVPVRKGFLFRRSATLRSLGLGKLARIDEGIWLWELNEEQIQEAEALLDEAGLIIK